MAKQTLIAFLLDETGSMMSCFEQTVSGYNEYITSLKKNGKGTRFTLTKFNSEKIDIAHDAVKIKDVPELNDKTYQPDAMTPLYDAIGRTIRATELAIKATKKMAVLFVIMTDGMENASKEFTQQSVLDLVKAKEKDGWTFVFLGADQDAWAAGQQFGMRRGNTMSYDSAQTKQTMHNLAQASISYRDAGSKQVSNFWDQDKD